MASVRKREWTHKGEKKTAWIVDYVDSLGKRRQKTFERKKEADSYRNKVAVEVESGLHVADSQTVTVAEAVKAYEVELQRRNRQGDLGGACFSSYVGTFKVHILPWIGRLKVKDITADIVEEKINAMRDGYSSSTVRTVHSLLKLLLTFCVKKKWVRFNVLTDSGIKLPKKKKRTAIPSRADIATLLDFCRHEVPHQPLRNFVLRKLIVNIGVFCGLRPGEIFGLQWSDIDFDNDLIRVRHSYSAFDGLKTPKTDAGIRAVPMTEPVKDALTDAAWYQLSEAYASRPGWRSYSEDSVRIRTRKRFRGPKDTIDPKQLDGYLIVNTLRQPYTTHTANKIWHATMRLAGLWDKSVDLPMFTMHALRHAAASLFIAANLPVLNLKQLIGHASISTTFDVYGHLFPEDERTAQTAKAISTGFIAAKPQHDLATA